MKILFIGNSHTYFNDMPHMFQKICAENGIPADVTMLAHGGMGLDFHREQPEVRFNILYGNFDYIVLQHAAHPFGEESVLFSAAGALCEIITQTQAKPVLYMTWSEKKNEAGQERMADAYLRLGKELNALVAPVGLAWWQFHRAHPDTELYFQDGEHASPIGSMLAAFTIFSAIFKQQAKTAPDWKAIAEAAYGEVEKQAAAPIL